MNRFLAGALGGLLATVPMTVVMTKLFERLPPPQQYPLPPREITETVVTHLKGDQALRDAQLTKLSLSAHFAYGAIIGAPYPLLFRRPRHPMLCGGAYGLAVWAASYLGWIPAARILRPATEHPGRRNALMLVAHWVWGATTAVVNEAIVSRASNGTRLARQERSAACNSETHR